MLTASAADLCYVVPDHPGRQSAAIITKGLGILKLVTTTEPQILTVNLKKNTKLVKLEYFFKVVNLTPEWVLYATSGREMAF